MNPIGEIHQPLIYQIKVKGTLDPSWSDWFGGLAIDTTADGSTLLSGTMRDQSALHGVLAKIRDMGLLLISVQLIYQCVD